MLGVCDCDACDANNANGSRDDGELDFENGRVDCMAVREGTDRLGK